MERKGKDAKDGRDSDYRVKRSCVGTEGANCAEVQQRIQNKTPKLSLGPARSQRLNLCAIIRAESHAHDAEQHPEGGRRREIIAAHIKVHSDHKCSNRRRETRA